MPSSYLLFRETDIFMFVVAVASVIFTLYEVDVSPHYL